MDSNLPQQTAVFRPEVFEVSTLAEAMGITVTPELGTSTQERWEKETNFLVEDIGKFLPIGAESVVLDYGCGTGRIAKGLIDKFGCRVVGVDTAKAMRLLSPEYVLSERFTAWSPDVLDKMIAKGFRADFAICLWVIQHAFDPRDLIQRIARALPAGGLFYSLNQTTRCVPTDRGWVNDGFDMRAGLCELFVEEELHSVPVGIAPEELARATMIQILRKPGE